MKYEVETKFVFSGTFTVEADSPVHAKEYVEKCCSMVTNRSIATTLSTTSPCYRVDWDFPVHPEKIVGKPRRV